MTKAAKRVLFLGASHFQIPPILYAKKAGLYTITCDNRPENPGHAVAHEWHNVSTTDEVAVLQLAKKLKINGIVAYASDPAAPTAAYVAEKMGLPGNPYPSVKLLTHKDDYRKFLHAHGFYAPRIFDKIDSAQLPVVIKPVDSSGSKGITILKDMQGAQAAIDNAMSFSRCKRVIFEEFIKRDGYQIAGDGFVVGGKLVFRCFANEHFNGIVPIGESFPYIGSAELQQKVHDEVQRLLTLLGMRHGALNFDIVIKDNNVYLMEIGPRNGGCLIPDVIKYSTGVDMAAYTVKTALGEDCSDLTMKPAQGFYSSYMVHSDADGIYKGIQVSEKLQIIEQTLLVKEGDPVSKYTGSHCTLGTMIVKFDSQETMLKCMNDMTEYVKVLV